MHTIVFKQCKAILWNPDYLETVFFDGLKTPALFIVNDETSLLATKLGYHDVRKMHYEHELLHTYLSERLGRPFSFVLRRVALGLPWTFDEQRSDEEALVLGYARYLNTPEGSVVGGDFRRRVGLPYG